METKANEIYFKFITGGAGTGKSFTLKEMTKVDTTKSIIVAPTGIAAINAGGSTIHSAFRIDPGSGYVDPKIKRSALRGLHRIYIDEVSMVSADLLKSIHTAAEMLGVREIIAFGDLAQLKPVTGGFFFDYRKPDETVRLEKNYRQGSDLEFAEILNRIRTGRHTMSDIAYINKNMGSSNQGMTLAYSNQTVNAINKQELDKLDGEIVENNAAIEGNMKPSDVPAPECLQVKEGCKIVMLNNDQSKRWQNGTRGEIVRIFHGNDDVPSYIEVKIGEEIHKVDEFTWSKRVPAEISPDRHYELQDMLDDWDTDEVEYAKHTLANGFEMKVTGSFTQFPMKLGYASTVHKSQGLTLNECVVHPDGFGTSHGLGYVALSRLTNVKGLTTLRRLRKDDFLCSVKVLPHL